MNKKILRYLLPITCICLMLTSCGHKLKRCSGVVTYIQNDTLKMSIGNENAVLITKGANFDSGAVVVDDSAEVTYLGSISEGKAVLVRLIPKKGHIIDIKKDTTKVVMSSIASPDKIKKFKKLVNEEKEKQSNK